MIAKAENIDISSMDNEKNGDFDYSNTEAVQKINLSKDEFWIKASNGGHDLYAAVWKNESIKSYKGIIQIAHGMNDYMDRYEELAEYFAKKGYVVFGMDNAGHGRSVESRSDLGHFGDGENNWMFLVMDMRRLRHIAKREYPGLKHILFAFSFSSFVAKEYIRLYGREIDGVILCGTCRRIPIPDFCIKLCNEHIAKSGPKTPGFVLTYFGLIKLNLRFNLKTKPRRTDFDWLCSVDSVVDDFIADPLCGNLFSFTALRDMFRLTKEVDGEKWARDVPRSLPILLASGSQDPLGEFGVGIKEIFDDLKHTGHKKVTIKIFAGCRHEIFHEYRKAEVLEYLLRWTEKTINSSKTKALPKKTT